MCWLANNKGIQAVKLCTNKILQLCRLIQINPYNGRETMVVVTVMKKIALKELNINSE